MSRRRNADADSPLPTPGAAPQSDPETITLELPIGAGESPGYQSELIEAGEVSLDQPGAHFNLQIGPRGAAAFARVRNGLRDSAAKLPGGRPVWSNADALRWIMEAMADALDS
jgi:hypothetical protein